ncbi:YuzD family protein [Siminovitchia terrae]|uniref:DUF1462 family protein n=1 Tax=Siminovitchia terrae TaxID=1914933 RepID=A0A429X696_SIMTE|nr:YuzD family protein [Siminovitchia terrae]RST58914.1 DUF1462 family protein [Siminovitchia terrae]GIN88995.1 putative disulfide oxidoreductase YuzD [Siminovitchia terrae]
MKKEAEIFVYGAKQICASCVNLPSSMETYEWLEAAISRKFPEQPFKIRYIDIFNPPDEESVKEFAERVIDEDLFYPVVTMDAEIIGEGNPRLKDVYQKMEEYGYRSE